MNRQQVLHRQILIGAVVAVGLLVVLGIHFYLLSFAYQVRVGQLTEVVVASSSGGSLTWKDPATLAEIRAALPGYKPGPGTAASEHGHESLMLVLIDERGAQISLSLPVTETPEVGIDPRPRSPQGNSWSMPHLLGVLAKYGLPEMEAKGITDPLMRMQFEYWRDHFGAGKTQTV